VVGYFRQHREEIAKDITRQMGKPIVQAREEVDYSVERMEVLINMAESALAPEIVQQTANITKKVIREPIGTVIILSAFDNPVLSIVNHLAPAILCGNSVLMKDNPRSPLSKYLIP